VKCDANLTRNFSAVFHQGIKLAKGKTYRLWGKEKNRSVLQATWICCKYNLICQIKTYKHEKKTDLSYKSCEYAVSTIWVVRSRHTIIIHKNKTGCHNYHKVAVLILVSTKVVNLQLSFSVESGLELKLLFVRRSAFKDGEADSAQIDIDRRAITTKKRKRRTRRIKNWLLKYQVLLLCLFHIAGKHSYFITLTIPDVISWQELLTFLSLSLLWNHILMSQQNIFSGSSITVDTVTGPIQYTTESTIFMLLLLILKGESSAAMFWLDHMHSMH
jgi:hypothetical protein